MQGGGHQSLPVATLFYVIIMRMIRVSVIFTRESIEVERRGMGYE
jgi:hypothetical protein